MEKQYDGYQLTFTLEYKSDYTIYTIEVNKNWLKMYYACGILEKLLMLRCALEQRKITPEYDLLYVSKVSLYVIENGEATLFEEQDLRNNKNKTHRVWNEAYKSIFF